MMEINFNAGVLCLGMNVLLNLQYPTQPLNLYESIYAFFTTGVTLALAQFFFIPALKITKKFGNVTLMNFTSVIFGYIISIYRYG